MNKGIFFVMIAGLLTASQYSISAESTCDNTVVECTIEVNGEKRSIIGLTEEEIAVWEASAIISAEQAQEIRAMLSKKCCVRPAIVEETTEKTEAAE